MVDIKLFFIITKEQMYEIANSLNITIENEFITLLATNLFAWFCIALCIWIIMYIYNNMLSRKVRKYRW